ncbi:RNA-directed DNA polymerase from mobile element jockey [Trichonephila clavipes]|nr:RNA-directed DNA polymerase from mobile element jockey [Trichonephila clavipes]
MQGLFAPYTPTHINSRSRPGVRDSIIDLAVFKKYPFNYDIRVKDDLCSDHLPVILTLYTNSDTMKIQRNSPPIGRTSDSFLKMSHFPFRRLPAMSISTLRLVGLEKISPKHLWLLLKPKFKTAPIKLPPDIRSKIRHRNRVRRILQRSRDPALKNELRTISNEIASDIRHLSRARSEKTIEELSPKQGTLWRRVLSSHPPKERSRQYRSCPD